MMRSMVGGVATLAVVMGLSLTAQTGRAGEHDMRLGTFTGNWCGFPATFQITGKRGNTWVFDGKVTLKATGQVDKITVVQYEDNHLRIVRHLSGAHAGTNQWVDTHPPETLRRNGQLQVNFPVRSAGGYGAKVLGNLVMPKSK